MWPLAVLTRINGVFVKENVWPFFRDKKKLTVITWQYYRGGRKAGCTVYWFKNKISVKVKKKNICTKILFVKIDICGGILTRFQIPDCLLKFFMEFLQICNFLLYISNCIRLHPIDCDNNYSYHCSCWMQTHGQFAFNPSMIYFPFAIYLHGCKPIRSVLIVRLTGTTFSVYRIP